MSRLDLSLAAAALTACLGFLPGSASAQTINPNISANAGIAGQVRIVNMPRICGVHIKCETPKSKQPSGEQTPNSPRRR